MGGMLDLRVEHRQLGSPHQNIRLSSSPQGTSWPRLTLDSAILAAPQRLQEILLPLFSLDCYLFRSLFILNRVEFPRLPLAVALPTGVARKVPGQARLQAAPLHHPRAVLR